MEPADIAVTRFEQGYSCAQAVFSALAERRGVELELALRVSSGLGGGIARTAQTCGCLTGAILAMGLDQSSVAPEANKTEKEKTYHRGQILLCAFEDRHGTTLCRDLLGCDIGTPEGLAEAREKKLFKLRCAGFVRDAVEMVESGVARKP